MGIDIACVFRVVK